MNERDFHTIEQALGITLPGFYKKFMMTYDREQLFGDEPSGHPPVTEWEFADNAARVIELNREVRANPSVDLVGSTPWPDRYLIIGREDYQGYFVTDSQKGKRTRRGQSRRESRLACNYFVINWLDGDRGVFLRSRVDGVFHRVSESLEGYCEFLAQWWDHARESSPPCPRSTHPPKK
jgi:hypothetical protein